MTSVLTKNELYCYLKALKTTVQNLDYSNLKNIVFLNLQSLYHYLNKLDCNYASVEEVQFCPEGNTVEEVMDIIEPYIPFALSDTTLNFFIDACNAASESDMKRLERQFNSNSKMDFINIVRLATDDGDWHRILGVCENLRLHHENEVPVSLYM